MSLLGSHHRNKVDGEARASLSSKKIPMSTAMNQKRPLFDISQSVLKKGTNSKLVSPRSPTISEGTRVAPETRTAKKPIFSSRLISDSSASRGIQYSDASPERAQNQSGPSAMMKTLNQRITIKRKTQPYSPKPHASVKDTSQESLINLSVPLAFSKAFAGSSC